MNREITIRYKNSDTVYVNGVLYKQHDMIFAGYADENEATLLKIYLPNNWEDYTYTLKFCQSGTWADATTSTDTEIEYEIPTKSAGKLVFAIEAVSDTQTVNLKPIFFEIKKSLA